jgi:flagellar basal-body rod modification protein FlgD
MSPTSNVSSNSGTGSQGTAASPTTTNQTVNQNMFLQLLVAQLKNQDPSNPPDGLQFVSELAQFQQVEQSVNTGQDITAIRSDLESYISSQSK